MQNNQMRIRGMMRWVLLPAVLLTGVALLLGQGKDEKQDPNLRNVEGFVTDANDQPVPRAIVQLKDLRTLQIRSFVAQGAGDYRFTGLRRDTDYELSASYGDLKSDAKRLTVFDNRATARVNLKLEKP